MFLIKVLQDGGYHTKSYWMPRKGKGHFDNRACVNVLDQLIQIEESHPTFLPFSASSPGARLTESKRHNRKTLVTDNMHISLVHESQRELA